MWQTFGYVKQISGDENPIWVKLLHSCDGFVMPWVISVQVQIREMDRTRTGQRGMPLGEDGDLVIGQTPFPMRNEAKPAIEGLAEARAYERPQPVRP
jgi:hypothetical protein